MIENRMELKIKARYLISFVLFFPFFLPHSIVMLEKYSLIWTHVYNVIAIIRCLISVLSVFVFILNQVKPNLITKCVFLYQLSIFVACTVNDTITFRFTITNCITYIGFACLLQLYDRENKDALLESLLSFFSFMSFIGAISILLFPDGINNAPVKNQAIYFLGSKNNSFFYFMMFMFLKAYKSDKRYRNSDIALILFGFLFMICTLITDSMNGTLMIFILTFYFVVRKCNIDLKKIFTPKNVMISVVLFAILIPSFTSGKFDWFFDLLGRESNFSMRTYIWASAFVLIQRNPLFGNGKDGDVILYKGQTQAHNIYIDYATKYGLINLIIFILMLVMVITYMSKAKNSKIRHMCSLFFFVYFVHALFDSVTMPFTITFLYFCYCIGLMMENRTGS